MILEWLVSSLPFVAASGALAAIGLIGSALGLFLSPLGALLARYGGVVMLGVACFGFGVRSADTRAEQARLLQIERNKIAQLERDLTNQKLIAADAAARRNALAQEKATLDEKVATYEAELQKRQTNANPACTLTDSDFRHLDSLRNKPRR